MTSPDLFTLADPSFRLLLAALAALVGVWLAGMRLYGRTKD